MHPMFVGILHRTIRIFVVAMAVLYFSSASAQRAARPAAIVAAPLLDQAHALVGNGQAETALTRLEAASRFARNPALRARYRYELGFAFAALERWREAENELRAALREPQNPWIAANLDAIIERYNAVGEHVSMLQVRGRPEDARIRFRGEEIGRMPMETPIVCDPGAGELVIDADGHQPTVRALQLRGLHVERAQVESDVEAALHASVHTEAADLARAGVAATHSRNTAVRQDRTQISAEDEDFGADRAAEEYERTRALREREAREQDEQHVHELDTATATWGNNTVAERDTTWNTVGWVSIIGGVLFLGTGALMTGLAFSTSDRLSSNTCQPTFSGESEARRICASDAGLYDAALPLQWIGYGVGALLLGTGVAILTTQGQREDRLATTHNNASCAPRIGATQQGVVCSVSF